MSRSNDEARDMYLARLTMPAGVFVSAPRAAKPQDDRKRVMIEFFDTVKKVFQVEPDIFAAAQFVNDERFSFECNGHRVIIYVNACCRTTVAVDSVKYDYYHGEDELFPDGASFATWVNEKKAEDAHFASLFPKPFSMKVIVNQCYGNFGLSQQAISVLASRGYDVENKDDDDLRVSPEVIAVVEELGKLANAKKADLHVIEVPLPQDQWYIMDYDGSETVYENHRRWPSMD